MTEQIRGTAEEQRAQLQRIINKIAASHGLVGHVGPISTQAIYDFGAALRDELEAAGATWPLIRFVGGHVVNMFDFRTARDAKRVFEVFTRGFQVHAERVDGVIDPEEGEAFIFSDLKSAH